MTDDIERYQHALLTTLERAHAVGYSGYSKFDGLLSPVTQALSFGWWPLRLAWTQLVMHAPMNVRPWLRVRQGVNPEGPALFAHANLACVEMGESGPLAERAQQCLDGLLRHDASAYGDYHGRCWGYHHPWQSTGFYQPPHFPNCYMTAIVGGALLHGYRVLERVEYLEAARSAADFMLHDLHVFQEDDEAKCIAYVPHMRTQLQVVNINALAGAFLAQVGTATDERSLFIQARKLMAFVARHQTSYGAWYYTTEPRQSLVTHDNYHTGMILDALWAYEQERLPMTAQIVRMNRKGGPEGVIDVVEELAPNGFTRIDEVLSHDQRMSIVRGYASTAGFSKEQVNKAAKAA